VSEKKIQVSRELSDLVLTPAKHLDETGLQWHIDNGKCYQITSFAEVKGLNMAISTGNLLSQFNSHAMSRIYPKGLRIDSSNYNPLPYWYCGCQIVALNYQTPDFPMRLNEGKFMKNGRSGYIIKPDCLRRIDGKDVEHPGLECEAIKTLEVTIISAWRLKQKKHKKLSSVNISVSLYTGVGQGDDNYPQTFVISDVTNLHNPTFNEKMVFNIYHEELDIIMFEVLDSGKSKDPLLYYYSIPIDCMRQGYRLIDLKDTKGREVKESELLVKVELKKLKKKN